MSELILPAGYDLEKAANIDGKGKVHGLTPWQQVNARQAGGATLKKGRWDDYYDMYRQHSIVRAAIDKIAKTATTVGFDFTPRDSRAKIKPKELAIVQEFFSKQNDFIAELRKIYKDLLIYGDAYLYVVPDRRRRPIRLKRLAPQTIHIKASKNGTVEAYFQKDLLDVQDNVVRFEPHELLHFKLDDPNNDIYGLSPLESLRWAVGADLYAQRYNASFFENSGVSGTIIGIRNANPAEVERNRKWLLENYTGPDAAHKPLIFEGESIEIKKSVATHQEMGFLEGRRFIILEILAVLDVPPAKVGIMETANRSNSKEQDKTFRTESIDALQYIVEAVINDQFIRKILGVENTIFVHSEGDTRDAIEQMDLYKTSIGWGVLNVNEVRSRLGMAPVEGGDINGIMTPTGFVPLNALEDSYRLLQAKLLGTPGVPSAKTTKPTANRVAAKVTKSLDDDDEDKELD